MCRGKAEPHGLAAKAAACGWVCARLLLWPVFLLHELILIPHRFVLDEPASEEGAAAATASQPSGLRLALASLLTPSGTVPLRRLQHSYQRSWLLLYESVALFAAVGALELFGIDRLAAAFKPELTRLAHTGSALLAAASGCAHGGPSSLINAADPGFSLSYDAASFPFAGGSDSAGVGGGGSSAANGHANGGAANGGHANGLGSSHANGGLCANGHSLANGASNGVTASRAAGGSRGKGSCGTGAGATACSASQKWENFRKQNWGSNMALADAHLLCMCAKLVYEEEPRIRAVAREWGLAFRGLHCAPAHASAAEGYVPDVAWMVLESRAALVVAFRGADPFTQVSRRADIPIAKTARPGMGAVLDGFHRALFHRSGNAAHSSIAASAADGPRCEFELLESRLRSLLAELPQHRLYLTGHSIGGAMAAVFAQALHARASPLVGAIGGATTFGQPRCGDATWAALLDARMAGRCLRFTHACDMVPELPTAFAGYAHHGEHVHIAAEGLGRRGAARLISEAAEPKALAAAVAAEDRWAFPLQFAALGAAFRIGGLQRAAGRAFLLPLPGLADHFPLDYEHALRAALDEE